jgi:hypothetical protein
MAWWGGERLDDVWCGMVVRRVDEQTDTPMDDKIAAPVPAERSVCSFFGPELSGDDEMLERTHIIRNRQRLALIGIIQHTFSGSEYIHSEYRHMEHVLPSQSDNSATLLIAALPSSRMNSQSVWTSAWRTLR